MRVVSKSILKTGTVIALLAVFLPGQALAQTYTCSSELTMDALGEGPFYINELIPIELTLEAQTVSDGTTPGVLNIGSFDYKPDCSEGTTFDNCTAAGNTVVIDTAGTDVRGTCGADFSITTPDAGLTYVFTPVGDPVRIDAMSSCTVEFDIMVQGVASGTAEIFESSGWAESQATCSGPAPDYIPYDADGPVGSAASSDISLPMSTQRVGFIVTKDFTDDSDGEAVVHLRCNGGLPLQQSFTLVDGGHVTFAIKDFPAGSIDCQVYEDPIPEGYAESYVAGDNGGDGIATEIGVDEEGCFYNGVTSGSFTCDVSNMPGPGEFIVNKEWIIGEADGEDIDLTAPITIFCNGEILADDVQSGNGIWWVQRELLGLYDSTTVTVDTGTSGTVQCEAIEAPLMVGLDVDNGCAPPLDVDSGEQTSCLITNTIYFEGIPTLSQMGMALMALLMLGVGMVGMRRFV